MKWIARLVCKTFLGKQKWEKLPCYTQNKSLKVLHNSKKLVCRINQKEVLGAMESVHVSIKALLQAKTFMRQNIYCRKNVAVQANVAKRNFRWWMWLYLPPSSHLELSCTWAFFRAKGKTYVKNYLFGRAPEEVELNRKNFSKEHAHFNFTYEKKNWFKNVGKDSSVLIFVQNSKKLFVPWR